MRILLILFLLTTWAFSSEIIIKDNGSSYKDFEVNYYQDKSKKLSIENIQSIKEFQKINNNIALGKKEGNNWYHFSIRNLTKILQKRVIFITEPTLWDVELFIIEDKKIVSTQALGQTIISKDGKVLSNYPELEINLEAGEKIDIYIRNFSPFQQTFKVDINTSKDLIDYRILKNSLVFLYFGAIGALLLYNLFIYFSIRDKNYLLYIGFVFFYLLAQVALNTPFNSLFSSSEITFMIASSHVFWVAFHTLFSVKLLNIKEYYPRLDKYLLYTGYFLLAVGFYGIYNLYIAIHTVHLLMIILPFILLFSAIKLHLKKNKIAIFYIIAQTLFLTSSLVFGLLYAGVLEYNNFTRYINLFGSFSEIILFSFALAYKTKLIMQENQKQKELVDEYSKLSFLGQTMVNISHQWKSPINNIYNSINHIEIAKEFKDPKLDEIIDTNMKNIKDTTMYLKDTALNQLNFYKEKENKEKINLNEEIHHLIKLIENEFTKKDIDIEFNCNYSLVVELEKNYFLNLLMIFFENSFKIFEQRKIENPKIILDIKKENSNLIIIFEDNAQGVSENMLDKIFEKNFSKNDSTGIGLSLAKEIVEYKLKGELSAKNTNKGLKFDIKIKL